MPPKALALAKAYSLWIKTHAEKAFFVYTKYYKQILGSVDVGIALANAFMWVQTSSGLQYYLSNIAFCKIGNVFEEIDLFFLNGPMSQWDMFWDEIVFLQRVWFEVQSLSFEAW